MLRKLFTAVNTVFRQAKGTHSALYSPPNKPTPEEEKKSKRKGSKQHRKKDGAHFPFPEVGSFSHQMTHSDALQNRKYPFDQPGTFHALNASLSYPSLLDGARALEEKFSF